MPELVPFRAHARLLTMLGDQLIKDERIALVELIKNSYDADASTVTVDFVDFGNEFETTPASRLLITDNGSGMSPAVVQTSWMNPATPGKAIRKRDDPRTPGGRILQGEKGIGRFASFKLGRSVRLVTREPGSATETRLAVDIGALDEGKESSHDANFFLDQFTAEIDAVDPEVFRDGGAASHGTRLDIADLRADWTVDLAKAAFRDIARLQPQLWIDSDLDVDQSFSVRFLKDGVDLGYGLETRDGFQAVLDHAVLRVTNGAYDPASNSIRFDLADGSRHSMDLASSEVRGLFTFKQRFKQADGEWLTPECGRFGFSFYVFDLDRKDAPAEYLVDSEEQSMVREHRVYLYRDGVRVYPYGDPNDDWLQVDSIRGTRSARSMFSNDQLVGVVTITQEDNPRLRDKTSREGLLEVGRATGDFVALVQTVLAYLRAKHYERYVASKRRAREKTLRADRIDRHIEQLRKLEMPTRAVSHLDALESALHSERQVAEMRIARTEQLAGVGMSVETASHDLISASTEALRMARHVVSDLRLLDLMTEPVFSVAQNLVLRLEFIHERFKDVQGLFVSTRQKRKVLDIVQLSRRVGSLYAALHKHEGITFEVDQSSALKAMTTEAAVLQCLINLVDNATYWLTTGSTDSRVIRIFTLDKSTLVVTDNGPGVSAPDEPFIFEPFYSGKGDAGKGLGLYIARQNGERSGFSVELASSGDSRQLSGATFVVRFNDPEEK